MKPKFPRKVVIRSPVLDCNCSAANFGGIGTIEDSASFLLLSFFCELPDDDHHYSDLAVATSFIVRSFTDSDRVSPWNGRSRLFGLILFAHLRDGDFFFDMRRY